MRTDRESIGAAMGRIPSGCCILTVEHAGQRTGVLVSWVQQAAFEPLSISVCVKKGRPAVELMERARRFLLNVVGEDPAAMFRHFGRGFGPEEDAFAGIRTEATAFGPLLPECIAHLGCELTQSLDVGDHLLYIASVIAGAGGGNQPYVHLRKSGLSY